MLVVERFYRPRPLLTGDISGLPEGFPVAVLVYRGHRLGGRRSAFGTSSLGLSEIHVCFT